MVWLIDVEYFDVERVGLVPAELIHPFLTNSEHFNVVTEFCQIHFLV